MGFIRDSFGRVCVESRRESFILHVDHGGAPGPSPEFLTADLDDVIAALSDYRASLFAAGRAAATPSNHYREAWLNKHARGMSDPHLVRDADVWDEAVAACRAAATPDPPDEAAIRADERERLSARVYKNGWCPTCGTKTADPGVIPGPDPGACPACGGWRKAGMIHRCPPVARETTDELKDALREIASFDAAGDARFDYRDVIRVKEIAAAALAADRDSLAEKPETDT